MVRQKINNLLEMAITDGYYRWLLEMAIYINYMEQIIIINRDIYLLYVLRPSIADIIKGILLFHRDNYDQNDNYK